MGDGEGQCLWGVMCSHPSLKLHDADFAIALVADVGVEHAASLCRI